MAFWIHLFLSRLAIIMLSVRHVSCVPSDVSATPTPQSCQPPTGKAIILDVDNTLYCEETLKRLTGLGIEEQIIANTHTFCKEHLDLTPPQADDLYRKYGTTIEGIRQEYPSQAETLLESFYHQVYDPIDFSFPCKQHNDELTWMRRDILMPVIHSHHYAHFSCICHFQSTWHPILPVGMSSIYCMDWD